MDSAARHAPTSSFDRWLRRTQEKHQLAHSDAIHVDPRGMSSGGGGGRSASATHPHLSRLEELDGLLFTRNHFTRLHGGGGGQPVAAAPIYPSHSYSNGYDGIEGYENEYPPSLPAHMQRPPTHRPLHLPLNDVDFSASSFAGGVAGDSALFSTGGGRGGGGMREPFPYDREPFGCSAYPLMDTTANGGAGQAEAERYIARLEEEVQMLMTESSDKDRQLVAAVALNDILALQLRERQRRAELSTDEHVAWQNLTYSFQRTLSFHRIVEERSRAMELNTQLSVLRHELKLAETMRERAEMTATTAAAASASQQQQQQQQQQQRKQEEQEMANAVSSTVRTLLQQEYARLAELVAEMPGKMESVLRQTPPPPTSVSSPEKHIPEKHITKETSHRDEATSPLKASMAAGTLPEQQRLYQLIESALAAAAAQGGKTSAADAGAPAASAAAAAPPSPASISPSDTARLLALVARMNSYQETVLDLYCTAVDTKSDLAQYEMNIVRLISEKQSSLTWAALYEDKKDEVKHLNEKLMELRGELRAYTNTPTTTTMGVSPRGMAHAQSFAGSTSSQSYEAFAAPYVPPKRGAVVGTSSGSGPAGAQPQPATRAKPQTKPIEELREEARRLGAHPAVHYPPPVTSPSPSMPSLYVSQSPVLVEQTVMKPLRRERRERSSHERATVSPRPASHSPVAVALLRTFDPHTGSRSSSLRSSASSRSTSPVPPKVVATVEKKNSGATHAAAAAKPVLSVKTLKKHGRSTRRSSSSTSASSESPPVTPPVAATRGVKINAAALQRVAVKARSPSRSSSSSSSAPSDTNPAPSPSAVTKASQSSTPARAAAAAAKKSTVKAQAVHNSFDDDGDSTSSNSSPRGGREAVEPAAVAKTTPAPAAGATKLGAASRLAFPPKSKPNTPSSVSQPAVLSPVSTPGTTTAARTAAAAKTAPPIKQISIGKTVAAIERAKQGDSDDDDTSSLTLSMTSSSAVTPAKRRAGPAATAPVAKASATNVTKTTARASATAAAAKPTHARKSSFDDDGSGDDADSTSGGGTGAKAPAPTTQLSKPTKASVPTSSTSSPKPALTSPPTTAVVKTTPATAAAPAAGAKRPPKLQLPTW